MPGGAPPRTKILCSAAAARAFAVSLTSMLKDPAVRAVFREAFPAEEARLKGALHAPPISSRPNLVGAAFDYLLRFRLEREFAACAARPWVAEEAVAGLNAGLIGCGAALRAEANARLEGARAAHGRYMDTGVVDDGLIGASFDLAQIDVFYRTGRTYDFVDADGADAMDLRGILGVAEAGFPGPERACHLNPDFGDASTLVGGADADIIIDGALIDIKTGRKLSFGQNVYNQLVGYYVLSLMGGINGGDAAELSSVGIYYARYGMLHTVPTAGIREAAEGGFMGVFEKAAKAMFPA